MSVELGVYLLVLGILVTASLLIYNFLIFPNIDGVAQDLSWYKYDEQSQHFLYWFFFWGTGGFGFLSGIRLITRK